jgi:hypothetical protein
MREKSRLPPPSKKIGKWNPFSTAGKNFRKLLEYFFDQNSIIDAKF